MEQFTINPVHQDEDGDVPCTNCGQVIIDPTNPADESAWVHVHTLLAPCEPEHLSASEAAEGGYVACPQPCGEDGPCGSAACPGNVEQ